MEKILTISLSINGEEGDEFTISLDSEIYDRLEQIYREESSRESFVESEFWKWLKAEHSELAQAVRKAIEEELSHYIFEDDYYDFEGPRPDECFPLADLNFDYLTADGKRTMRHFNCTQAVIYSDNDYDCDFSYSFFDEE